MIIKKLNHTKMRFWYDHGGAEDQALVGLNQKEIAHINPNSIIITNNLKKQKKKKSWRIDCNIRQPFISWKRGNMKFQNHKLSNADSTQGTNLIQDDNEEKKKYPSSAG